MKMIFAILWRENEETTKKLGVAKIRLQDNHTFLQ